MRSPNGIWILGMLRRLAISLLMDWRARQLEPHFKSLTDFHTVMGEENLAKAMRFVTNHHPRL